MPQTARRCPRRAARRQNLKINTVVTNPVDCCVPPETITEEIYSGIKPSILIENCCDPYHVNGCADYDTRRRCPYWPNFAHPRWLSCGELHSRRVIE